MNHGEHSHAHGRAGGPGVRHYQRDPGDPDWLVRAAEFHGHLGPWVTVGAMIGQDALQRLETAGQWDVEVICWMPPDQQRPPFSCILDGLQAGSGATMGKRNIRLDYSPDIVRGDKPVVHIVRYAQESQPAKGFVYEVSDELSALISGMTPDRLESISRQIAAGEPSRWFTIRPMTPDEHHTIAIQARHSLR